MSHEIFPEIAPYATRTIEVGEELTGIYHGQRHTLSIEEYGNSEGLPVIVVHGGPGAGCSPDYARFFDPDKYRIILYDQRGAGKSVPKACMQENTTHHLIEDLEAIRIALDLDKPLLFGGSWGSTLPLLYAQKYPKNVSGLVLRGIWLADEAGLSGFVREDCPAAQNNPEEWKRLKSAVNLDPEQPTTFSAIVDAYHERVMSDDESVWKPAAAAFSRWEAVNSYTDPVKRAEEIEWSKTMDGLTMARTEIYYMKYRCWLRNDTQILDDADKLASIPIRIVHGKQDDVCQPSQAAALVKRLEEVKAPIGGFLAMRWTEAGHSAFDGENPSVLVEFTEAYWAEKMQKNTEESVGYLTGVSQRLLNTASAASADRAHVASP
ncbi:MAG: alpha/beta fold hydrolase [Pseudomonadota bacterium]